MLISSATEDGRSTIASLARSKKGEKKTAANGSPKTFAVHDGPLRRLAPKIAAARVRVKWVRAACPEGRTITLNR